jgi:hypothetical protein
VIVPAAYGGYDTEEYLSVAERVVSNARRAGSSTIEVDPKTSEFIDFWFDPDTRQRLSALVVAILGAPQTFHAPLWCAFSRLIITKDAGVSRARDVSHSRPHRVRDHASFNAIDGFFRAAKTVAARANDGIHSTGNLSLLRGDARSIPLKDASIDGIMTSPPYLIAIDYLRGHRMSLVWMGHSIESLRALRSRNIGSHRGKELPPGLQEVAVRAIEGELPATKQRITYRYIVDMDAAMREMSRVLRPGGTATFVVANSRHSSGSVSVEALVSALASRHGLILAGRRERNLPSMMRYLPPPRSGAGALDKRMHIEVVLSFSRAAPAS